MKNINKGTRVVNFAIDLITISIISLIVSSIIGESININFLTILVLLTYYFLFEYFIGQTLGKIITKTVVTDLKNSRPSILRILIRTILRLNPFDWISYLFGHELGGHDILSKTKLNLKVHNKGS